MQMMTLLPFACGFAQSSWLTVVGQDTPWRKKSYDDTHEANELLSLLHCPDLLVAAISRAVAAAAHLSRRELLLQCKYQHSQQPSR